MEQKALGSKAQYLAFTFTWGKEQKAYGSFLVGTSPEFEMAVYTTCLLAREDNCKFKLFGQSLSLTIHTFFNGKYVASAYFD